MTQRFLITLIITLFTSSLQSRVIDHSPAYTFTPITDSLFENDMSNPLFINDFFYIEGRSGKYPKYNRSYFRSKTGIEWEPVDSLPHSDIQWPSVYGQLGLVNEHYLAHTTTEKDSQGKKRTVIHSSTDGIQWNSDTITGDITIYSATFGLETYMLVGFDGVVLVSRDGKSWTRSAFPTKSELRSVHFVNSQFLVTAVDLHATNFDETGEPLGHHFNVSCFSSMDGLSWNKECHSLPVATLSDYLHSVRSEKEILSQDKLEWVLGIENSNTTDQKVAFGNRTIVVTNRSNTLGVYHY